MRSVIGGIVTIVALMGLGAITASPALADESGYLRNLYSVGVPQGGTDVTSIYVKLGNLACSAQAAGYDKSGQEQMVAAATSKMLQLPSALSVSAFANRVARSARMFLC